ncbi:MAG TPA: energy transducer TonB, partial [Bacteroidota bacterium]
KVAPDYPYAQEFAGSTGDVIVKLWVTKTGNVKEAIIMSTTNPVFNKYVLKAAVMWKFRPASFRGKAVSVWVSVPFHFRIHR